MSEEIALAAADLATVEQLRARVLEWEDAYDRLAGAFDLHMDIRDCQAALSSYAGVFYDVVLDELAEQLEHARIGLAAEQELRARSEMIVLAARKVVAGPDSVNYTRLAAAIDAYDKAVREPNVTKRAQLFNKLLNQGKEGST